MQVARGAGKLAGGLEARPIAGAMPAPHGVAGPKRPGWGWGWATSSSARRLPVASRAGERPTSLRL
jgi:hypothetical protein